METSQTAEVAAYLIKAANIASPWRATKCHFDSLSKGLHIWITRHPVPQTVVTRNWLGMLKSTRTVGGAPPKGPELVWRHLNCMDFNCFIHTNDVLDARHHDLPWLGQQDLPFTNRMARHLFMCIAEGLDFAVICQLYNLTFAELWKFKYALDQGMVRFDYQVTRRARRDEAQAAEPSKLDMPMPTDAADSVPDSSHPVWERILLGTSTLDIRTLGFQLILTKLRKQVQLQQSEEVQIMKIRELHRYVDRNAKSLGSDLKQIQNLAESLES